MRIFLFITLSSILCFGCQPEKKADMKRVEEINGVPNAADIIRNPISAKGNSDTTNVAKMVFEKTEFDFGTVNEGDKVKHTFKFKNEGLQPLLIGDARSTCGCTVPKWPKEAIAPGGTGKIDVVFNTTDKPDKQHKPITITANTFPSKTVLHLRGMVTPKNKN